jgi:hypothetical protein
MGSIDQTDTSAGLRIARLDLERKSRPHEKLKYRSHTPRPASLAALPAQMMPIPTWCLSDFEYN